MRKGHLLLSGLLLAVVCSFGQGFQKTYGDTGNEGAHSVQPTKDGGLVICGYTTSYGAGNSDAYLIKTNAGGDTVFTRTYGGSANEVGYYAEQLSDQGYIVVGGTTSFGLSGRDIYVLRTDADGFILWSKTFGGVQDEVAYSLSQTSDTGFVIVGSTRSLGQGNEDLLLLKLDFFGNAKWSKSFGGTGVDQGFGVVEAPDNGYVAVGVTGSFGISNEIYLVKVDKAGATKWTKTLGGSAIDGGTAITTASDGGFILSGYSNSFGSLVNPIVIKTDTAGAPVWAKTYAVGGGLFNSIRPAAGGYVLAGQVKTAQDTTLDALLVRINTTGDTVWARTYGGNQSDYAQYITAAPGGFAVAGITGSTGQGGHDVYVIKTDSSGHNSCNLRGTTVTVASQTAQVFTVISTQGSGLSSVAASTVIKGGGITRNGCISGIDEVAYNKGSLPVYPNPAGNRFNIGLGELNSGEALLQVMNMTGQIVLGAALNIDAQTNAVAIDASGWPTGMYMVKVTTPNTVFTGNVVIER